MRAVRLKISTELFGVVMQGSFLKILPPDLLGVGDYPTLFKLCKNVETVLYDADCQISGVSKIIPFSLNKGSRR